MQTSWQASLDSGDLSAWYAVPLDAGAAEALAAQSRQSLRACYGNGADGFRFQLQQAIARYWLGREVEPDIRNLLATEKDPVRRALVALVYGQLLVSCKRAGAWEYLDRGFGGAANRLPPDDYFAVLKRHERLRRLALSPRGAPGQPLDALLAEAEVIRRLQGDQPERPASTEGRHLDTLD